MSIRTVQRAGTPRRRLLAAAIPVAAAVLGAPAGASAADIQFTGSTLQYLAAANETNNMRVFTEGTRVVVDDSVPIRSLTAQCTNIDPTRVSCATPSTIAALLGNQNDSVFTQNSIPLIVDAGSGNDTYVGGIAQGASDVRFNGNIGTDKADYGPSSTGVTVRKEAFANDGRPGDRDNISSDVEELLGSSFADTLQGSDTAATERYNGRGGDDVINGLGGPDAVDMGSAADGADRVFLGAGTTDSVSYANRLNRVVVTANLFDNDDGEAGERDTIRETERVTGGRGNDDLSTFGGTSTAMTMIGGLGADSLSGGAAGDTLIGNAGPDRYNGRAGNDTISAKDNELDTIFCGDGLLDIANRDVVEREVSLCETGTVG